METPAATEKPYAMEDRKAPCLLRSPMALTKQSALREHLGVLERRVPRLAVEVVEVLRLDEFQPRLLNAV